MNYLVTFPDDLCRPFSPAGPWESLPSWCLHTATTRVCLTSRLAPRLIVQGCRLGRVRESSASGAANYFLMWRRFFWRACFLADQIPLKGSWGCKGRGEGVSCGRPHQAHRGSSCYTPPAVMHCRWDGQAPVLLLHPFPFSWQRLSKKSCYRALQKLWQRSRGCTSPQVTLDSTNGYKRVWKEIPGLSKAPHCWTIMRMCAYAQFRIIRDAEFMNLESYVLIHFLEVQT